MQSFKARPFFQHIPSRTDLHHIIPHFTIQRFSCRFRSLASSLILIMSTPTFFFGAGFLGVDFATPSALQDLLNFLRKNDISRIDTARRYPAINSGRSEQLLGEVNAAGQDFTIDTKIKVVGSDAKGSLTAVKIKESVAESLEALRVDEVGFQ